MPKRRASSLSAVLVLWVGSILLLPAAVGSQGVRDTTPDFAENTSNEITIGLPTDSPRRNSPRECAPSFREEALGSPTSDHAAFYVTPLPAKVWGRDLLNLIRVNRP